MSDSAFSVIPPPSDRARTGDPVYARVYAWFPPTSTPSGNWEGRLWSAVQDAGHLDCGGWDWDGTEGRLTCRCGTLIPPPPERTRPSFTPGDISTVAPFLAADAGHEDCAQRAYYDISTQLLLCGCRVPLYVLRAVA